MTHPITLMPSEMCQHIKSFVFHTQRLLMVEIRKHRPPPSINLDFVESLRRSYTKSRGYRLIETSGNRQITVVLTNLTGDIRTFGDTDARRFFPSLRSYPMSDYVSNVQGHECQILRGSEHFNTLTRWKS